MGTFMKKQMHAFLFTTLFAASAFAETTIVTKTNHPGHVSPDYGRSEICQVTTDRVIITTRYGLSANGVTTTEIRNSKVTGNLQKLLADAASETVMEKDNSMCDGPSTSIVATSGTLLFSSGGCGTPRKERTGVASGHLRAMIDAHCPSTHDYIAPIND